MIIPPEVIAWCYKYRHGEIVSTNSLGGGCINDVARLRATSGVSLILKQNPAAPPDMFPAEAEGLRALSIPGGPRIPVVYAVNTNFLLLEDLRPAPRGRDYWPDFGRRLAILHQQTHTHFGFAHDNYCGATPQPNPRTDNGHHFFAEYRLRYQARLAYDNHLVSDADLRDINTLCARLPELVPPQPPALIHGDLWSGNALTDAQGNPALIDPAAYFGWAEAELAMTSLFGSFPPSFYDAYEETYSLAPGWRNRVDLYNLYHLLNHVNLFGAGYLAQTRAALRRYL